MDRYKIGNLWVHFPFVPYAPQEVFMRKMIESMDNAQNALLESPTGTGKTLCLVCASLAWLDNQRKINEKTELNEGDHQMFPNSPRKSQEIDRPNKTLVAEGNDAANADKSSQKLKIYFCTRTHSQLIQAVNEFKNTSYGHLRSTSLGSRKQLCLNPCAIRAESNLDDKCASLIKQKRKTPCIAPGPDIEDLPQKCTTCLDDHRCQYYVNYEDMISTGRDLEFTQAPAMDQRTLIEKSRKHKVCPFYMSRHLQKSADIVFLPYSYIFNPHILRGLQLNVKDSIIIIDEGHNLERVCEENASFEMKISDIKNCRKEVVECLELMMTDNDDDFPRDTISTQNIQELENVLIKLETEASNRIKPGRQGLHYDGAYCLQIFEDAGFTRFEHERLLSNLKQLTQFLGSKERKTDGMRKIHNVVSTVYYLERDENESTLKKSFVLYKEVITREKLRKNPDLEAKICFWCFNAGIIMTSLKEKGVRSFIVTSGTLAPLEPLKRSLSIPFDINLLNEHVVDCSQILSLLITEAPTCQGDKKELLRVSYSNREVNGDQLYDALGNVIKEVVRYTPKGVLIFFPSSTVKYQCLTRWKNIFLSSGLSLFHEINNLKEIFEEPKEASELNELQLNYTSTVQNSSGACLIGVASGKVSEGIDFKDNLGRAVMMVGLPYPPYRDPWVMQKRSHLRETVSSAAVKEWYLSQAIRPVNQALGRIIRHQKDYGCVLLPDIRYAQTRVRRALPHWLEHGLRQVSFKELRPTLKKFFSTIPLRIKEIEKKTENEQANIRRRHLQELAKENCPADKFFYLQSLRDEEKLKEKKLNADIQLLEKALEGKKIEIEKLETAIAIAYALSLLSDCSTKEANNSHCKSEKRNDCGMRQDSNVKEEKGSHSKSQNESGDFVSGKGYNFKEDYSSDRESDGKSERDEAMS